MSLQQWIVFGLVTVGGIFLILPPRGGRYPLWRMPTGLALVTTGITATIYRLFHLTLFQVVVAYVITLAVVFALIIITCLFLVVVRGRPRVSR